VEVIVMGKLTDRVALVTGGSKGIGAGIAKALAAEGASVVVSYASSKAGADATVSDITADGGTAVAVGGDVTKAEEAQGLVDAAIESFGHLDIVVNNSGVWEYAPIDEITEEQFHRMFNTNVLGLLLTTRAAARKLGPGASIINIGSAVTDLTPPQSAIYTGTKGAVDAITGVLAKELAPRKVRVNSLNPGLVETEGNYSTGVMESEFGRSLVEHTPLGRVGQPEDIASVAVFLASDDSRWMTGEHVLVSGGLR
jgi:3-oxoacyl-[acyl-carrier protein] reductase